MNRRKFFSGMIPLTMASAAGATEKREDRQHLKMLTPDGKLVEVDEEVIKACQKEKVSSRDIFNWSGKHNRS